MSNTDLIIIITASIGVSCLLGFAIGKNMINRKSIHCDKQFSYKEKHDIGVLIEAYKKDKLRVERMESDSKMIYYRISLIEHNPGKMQLKFTDNI